MRNGKLTFDAAPSARSVDANGFLHVASSHITKATVNPYYGREIPGWERLGLDPERIYYGFRAPEELSASLPTWEGLPLHIEHHPDSADEPEKLTRVGKEKLQGRHVEARTDSGTIEAAFTGSGWGEIKKDMSQDPVKAELVPHMPDIISTGKYAAETPAHPHPGVKQFHTYRKTVNTKAGPREAMWMWLSELSASQANRSIRFTA